AKSTLHGRSELILRQSTGGSRAADGGEGSAAQERDEMGVVEVTCLKSGILTIVGEAQELSLAFVDRASLAVHPPQRARYEKRGGGTATLAREATQLGKLARLSGRLV